MTQNSLRVAYSFPNRVGVPGIGSIAWQQVSGLIQQGVEVTLFCGSCERPVPGLHRLYESMKLGGIKFPYRLIGNHRVAWLHDHLVAKYLRRRHNEFDLVHCWPLGSLTTLRTARGLGIPTFLERPNTHTAFAYNVVAREHDQIGLPVPKDHTHVYNARKLAQEEAEYAAADWLLCPSDFVARSFSDRGVSSGKLARHQYGFDPAAFGVLPTHDQPTLTRPFTAAFVGRCEPRKGLHYALEAWHRSGAAEHGRFIICGSFIEGYRQLLQKWLDHPSVEVMGFVSSIHDVMRQADVLMLPTVEEGSALVTYEARGAGCVLLVSNSAGAVCEHDRNALIHETANVEELTQHLSTLASDHNRLLELRRESVENLESLTWNNASRRLMDCYARGQKRASSCSNGVVQP